jgi:hypothetical protein
MLDGTRCILNKNFCSDALQTIKKFLYSVGNAERTKTQQENLVDEVR